jgi:hypothetical protein
MVKIYIDMGCVTDIAWLKFYVYRYGTSTYRQVEQCPVYNSVS